MMSRAEHHVAEHQKVSTRQERWTAAAILRWLVVTLALTSFPDALAFSQGSLVNGDRQSGAISASGEVDVWTFTAPAGGTVIISAVQTGAPSLFRPRIRLRRPDNVQIATDYGNEVARVSVSSLPMGGIYTVEIDSQYAGQTGAYVVSLALVPGPFVVPSGDQGGPLVNGVSQTGEAALGDVDMWRFPAAPGDHVSVSVGELAAPTGFSPWLVVVAPNGAVVAERNDPLVASLTFTAAQTGTYTVMVGAWDKSGTGWYRLTMVQVPGTVTTPEDDQGGPLTNGWNHSGVLQFGDLDVWTFKVTSPNVVLLAVSETAAPPGQTGGLWPWMRLYRPDGVEIPVQAMAEDIHPSVAAQAAFAATAAGTYTVVVGGGTGQYVLTMAALPSAFGVPAGDQGGPLTNGANLTGEISGGDIDMWTFTATTNEYFMVSLAEVFTSNVDPGFQPSVVVWGPTGQFIVQNKGTNVARVSAVAPQTGKYTVAVLDDFIYPNDQLGTYVIRLARAPAPQTAPPGDEGGFMTNGSQHTGILSLGDLDLWTFYATQGSSVTVTMNRVDGSFYPWAHLLGPNGVEIGSGSNSDAFTRRIVTTAPATGYYTVVATAEHVVSEGGNYRLTVTGASHPPSGTAVVTPSATNGTISPSSPQVVPVGTTLSFTLTPAAGHEVGSISSSCGGSTVGTVFTTGILTANCSVSVAFVSKLTPVHRRYLAEGATSSFFDTQIALLNPGTASAATTLTFLRGDATPVSHSVTVPPGRRMTIDPKTIAGLEAAPFSIVVESDHPLVVDRTMTWDGATGYGSHAETAAAAMSPVWYLAEGATHSGFDLFYLLQNPAPHPVSVRVRYLLPVGAPLEKVYTLKPASRSNIWVDLQEFDGVQALEATDVSAVIETLDGTPIVVERAMYLSSQGRQFNAGHASMGVTTPSTEWFLAEGATGDYFDLFVLIANPNDEEAQVQVTYLLDDGTTYTGNRVVPPNSRSSIWVDEETIPGVPGRPLANVAVSTAVKSTNGVPLIVERAMWWPGTHATWHEAHNSAGSRETGTEWALAEGEVGGARGAETYLLIANASPFVGAATVTLLFEDGTSAARDYALLPNSRTNVPVAVDFPEAGGRRFGAIVRSTGGTPAQIVVERAMYTNADGVSWAAGTNTVATKLR